MRLEHLEVREVEPNVMALEIRVGGEEVKRAFREVYRAYSHSLRLPGFRKGHIPPEVLDRLVGKERIRARAVDLIVRRAYEEAVRQSGINPIERAKVEVKEADDEKVFFKATVSVKPPVQLPEYKGLKAVKEKRKITDEDVEREIEALRERRAKWHPTDEPASDGHLVRGRLEVLVEGEKEPKREGLQFVMGRAKLIPDVARHLKGHKAGEVVEFEERYPDDFDDEELRGKKGKFKVEILSVSKLELPPLDDSFARQLGYSSVEDMRAKVRGALEEGEELRAQAEMEEKLLERVVEEAEIKVPRPVVENLAKALEEGIRSDVERRGKKWEEFLKESGKGEAEFREELRERAQKVLRRRFVVEALAEREGIEVSEEEVKERLKRTHDRPEKLEEDWEKMRDLPEVRSLRREMLEERVKKFLAQHAQIEEKVVEG